MKENLKDILSNLHSEVDQQTLLQYLQGQLSAQEQHEVEKNLINDEFEREALEGLQNFKDKKKIAALVDQLNFDLKKKTARKKKWQLKKNVGVEPGILIAIVIILVLAVISYIVIHKMKQ